MSWLLGKIVGIVIIFFGFSVEKLNSKFRCGKELNDAGKMLSSAQDFIEKLLK